MKNNSSLLSFLMMVASFVFAANNLYAAEYWNTNIPIMNGASDVTRDRDIERAQIRVSYDLVISDYREPQRVYHPFFESNGWKHNMSEVYSKFPGQFARPPSEDWSSFRTESVDGVYQIKYGSLWKNSENGSNATVTMTLYGLKGDSMKAHVEVAIGPSLDGSAFIELMQRAQSEPKELLKLASLVGGDPFDIGKVNAEKARTHGEKDEFTSLYKKAADSIRVQISDFSAKHLPHVSVM
jgi:hypothetical protein